MILNWIRLIRPIKPPSGLVKRIISIFWKLEENLKSQNIWPSFSQEIVSFDSVIHQWRFPCRRGTRVNISTPFIPVHVTFEYSVTNYTGSTDKERRLSRSTRNPWTSSMNKYPSERLFCLTIVLTVDEKWFTARIKPPQVRLIPVDDGMSEDTGGLD